METVDPQPSDASGGRRALIGETTLFRDLDAALIGELADQTRSLAFKRGETIFNQGDPASAFFIVARGWIKIYRVSPDGDETMIGVFAAGESFAEIAALAHGAYPANASAVTDVELIAVPARCIFDQVKRDPQTALIMLGSMSQKAHRLVAEIERLKGQSATERLADFLIEQSPHKTGMCAVQLPFEKATIAGRLGMKPESLSRAFRRLRPHGVVVKDDIVMINEIAALYRLAKRDG